MSLSDIVNDITGGANKRSEDDLANVLAQIQGIQTPTADQLKLSPLAQYESTGELSPAQMQAAESGPSAFDSENLPSVPNETMQKVLGQLDEISSSNGMTPQERAQIAQAEQAVNENTAGQRGAITQEFAGRGVPQSLIAAALENGTAGQESQQAYQNALQGEAGAANNAINARGQEGALAGKMFDQNAGQANTVAAAQNALNEFNAANTQQANAANQATTQAANNYNTTNKQNLSNENVTGEHQVQIQNQVEAPQEAAGLALQKGSELEKIGKDQSDQQTATGNQAAGLFGGLLGAGATLGAGGMAKAPIVNVLGAAPVMAADGGEIPQPVVPPTNFKVGGPVLGQARMPGDNQANDTVPARLSPGEVVLPRTVVNNPKTLGNFLAAKAPVMAAKMAAHPSDIASVIRALGELRGGA